MAVREAAIAGLFYPKREAELAKTLDDLLAEVKPAPVANLRGLPDVAVIERDYFDVTAIHVEGGKCRFCEADLSGVRSA